ncbi:MAG TPA: DUF3224 domain-containing protein [Acidobacteriaceae bacterium]|nr:DUF3224 domain-containing protein [Acidobacteriaceae bacterium]
MEISKHRAAGHINVTSFEAQPYDDAGAFSISEVHVTEEFAGELVGVGSVRFIMVNEPEGAAHFTGMERFLGKVGERSGSFILQNSGSLQNGMLNSQWRIIPGSGAEGLEGIRGEGGCDPSGYTLDYWFE